MRAEFPPPPPSLDALADLTPHEIIRRYPESLGVFRRHGVDLKAAGARPLETLLVGRSPEEGRGLLREVGRALSWRARGSP